MRIGNSSLTRNNNGLYRSLYINCCSGWVVCWQIYELAATAARHRTVLQTRKKC